MTASCAGSAPGSRISSAHTTFTKSPVDSATARFQLSPMGSVVSLRCIRTRGSSKDAAISPVVSVLALSSTSSSKSAS